MVLAPAANVLYIVCIWLVTLTVQKLHAHHMCAGYSYRVRFGLETKASLKATYGAIHVVLLGSK